MAKLSDDLLSVLRCPVTGSSLTQEGQTLITTVPGPEGEPLRYSIEDGIALMLRPELLAS